MLRPKAEPCRLKQIAESSGKIIRSLLLRHQQFGTLQILESAPRQK
jgi:hypothetical protein